MNCGASDCNFFNDLWCYGQISTKLRSLKILELRKKRLIRVGKDFVEKKLQESATKTINVTGPPPQSFGALNLYFKQLIKWTRHGTAKKAGRPRKVIWACCDESCDIPDLNWG